MQVEATRKTRAIVAVTLAIMCVTGYAVAAEETSLTGESWPQFHRDSARTGDNPGANLQWPLNRTMAIKFPSAIYASPAVLDGKVYIQDARGNVACVSAKNNTLIWTTPLGGINNMSSPAVTDSTVYMGNSSDFFCLLNAADGSIKKKIPVDGQAIHSPALTKDAVYFSTINGKLYKIDLDGNLVWTFDGGESSYTEIAVRNKRIVFAAGTGGAYVHLLEDQGKEVKLISKHRSQCPTSGMVMTSDKDYFYQSFDSEEGYINYTGGYHFSDRGVHAGRGVPAVRGNLLFRGDTCWDINGINDDLKNGKLRKHPSGQWGPEKALGGPKRKLWRVAPEFLYDGGFHSSPALAAEHLVIGSELGKLYFVALDGSDKIRKPAWAYSSSKAGQPNGGISSSPAVVNGAVYFGGEDGILYGLGKGKDAEVVSVPVKGKPVKSIKLTGHEWHTPGGDMGYSFVSPDKNIKPPFKLRWRTKLWDSYKSPMIVADGRVFCTGRSGLLAALNASSGEILWTSHHPGVESRPGAIYYRGKLLIMRARGGQGDSPCCKTSSANGGPDGAGIWCHDAQTGKLLWHYHMHMPYHHYVDGLSIANDKIVLCELTDTGAVNAFAVDIVTGQKQWTTPLEKNNLKDHTQLHTRFCSVASGDTFFLSYFYKKRIGGGAVKGEINGGTFALDARNGNIVWERKDISIRNRTRMGFRNQTVVLFDINNAVFGLDPATGATRWQVKPDGSSAQSYTGFAQALTDRYLESEGTEDFFPEAYYCRVPIYANRVWYSHGRNKTQIAASVLEKGTKKRKEIWTHPFHANACLSPGIAYGKLYYSPDGEGIIYCFEPEE